MEHRGPYDAVSSGQFDEPGSTFVPPPWHDDSHSLTAGSSVHEVEYSKPLTEDDSHSLTAGSSVHEVEYSNPSTEETSKLQHVPPSALDPSSEADEGPATRYFPDEVPHALASEPETAPQIEETSATPFSREREISSELQSQGSTDVLMDPGNEVSSELVPFEPWRDRLPPLEPSSSERWQEDSPSMDPHSPEGRDGFGAPEIDWGNTTNGLVDGCMDTEEVESIEQSVDIYSEEVYIEADDLDQASLQPGNFEQEPEDFRLVQLDHPVAAQYPLSCQQTETLQHGQPHSGYASHDDRESDANSSQSVSCASSDGGEIHRATWAAIEVGGPESICHGEHEPRRRSFWSVLADLKEICVLCIQWERYIQLYVKWPGTVAFTGLLIVVSIVGIGLAFNAPTIQADLGQLMEADGLLASHRRAFLDALAAPRLSKARRLQEKLYLTYKVEVIYQARKDDGNAFDMHALREIFEFENQVRALPSWRTMCSKALATHKQFCDPGLTFASYVFATGRATTATALGYRPEELVFDAKGADALPLSVALAQINRTGAGLSELLFPKSFNEWTNSARSKELRSLFRFRMHTGYINDDQTEQKKKLSDAKALYKTFLTSEVFPLLAGATLQNVHVVYGGDFIKEHEVLSTLFNDIKLAIGSVMFVWSYMAFHTRSFFLSTFGLVIIFLAIPLAYIVFSLMASSTQLNLASFLSLFLIVGLGSDVVFVFTDFWRQSINVGDCGTFDRMTWTNKHAVKSCAATSLTTAASFLANLASALRPLREFGVQMGLCIVFAFLLLTLLYPPLCIVAENKWCTLWHRRDHYISAKPSTKMVEQGRSSSFDKTGLIPYFFYYRWSPFVGRARFQLILGFSVILITTLALALKEAEGNSGQTRLFPEDHNQGRAVILQSLFVPADEAFPKKANYPSVEAHVCNEDAFGASNCDFHWCDMAPSDEVSEFYSCHCFREESGSCGAGLQHARCTARLTGLRELPVGFDDLFFSFVTQGWMMQTRSAAPSTRRKALGPLVMQEWHSGTSLSMPFLEVETDFMVANDDSRFTKNHDHNVQDCIRRHLCYCGTRQCLPRPGWHYVGQFDVWLPRVLAVERVPLNQRTEVEVVFGLQARTDIPLLGKLNGQSWRFNPEFDAAGPGVQRDLLRICRSSRMVEQLRVVDSRCWVEHFRSWLAKQNLRFPLHREDFYERLGQWIPSALIDGTQAKFFLWRGRGKLKAAWVAFSLDFSSQSSSHEALNMRVEWDQHLADFNAKASRKTMEAWHTSALWVRAEAQEALVSSTVLTIGIAVGLAFLGMLAFTRDFVLAFYVVLASIGVISGLFFFMVVLMKWTVGPIEVIALIVFVGYSVTYSLHIAHKYGDAVFLPEEHVKRLSVAAMPHSMEPATLAALLTESAAGPPAPNANPKAKTRANARQSISDDAFALPRGLPVEDLRSRPLFSWSSPELEQRYDRTRFALFRMCGAALGSAVTTVGCALFLLFCTMRVFNQLGAVLMAVTLLSVVYALIPLPALLITAGPLQGRLRNFCVMLSLPTLHKKALDFNRFCRHIPQLLGCSSKRHKSQKRTPQTTPTSPASPTSVISEVAASPTSVISEVADVLPPDHILSSPKSSPRSQVSTSWGSDVADEASLDYSSPALVFPSAAPALSLESMELDTEMRLHDRLSLESMELDTEMGLHDESRSAVALVMDRMSPASRGNKDRAPLV